jgi:hypothetical protein
MEMLGVSFLTSHIHDTGSTKIERTPFPSNMLYYSGYIETEGVSGNLLGNPSIIVVDSDCTFCLTCIRDAYSC